ncbi:glycine zipper 2TM domain-containing protein [Dechloromonas sp. XY25]|uniref:Glycine zipper 2TM domain-containing protein n=1 Tax=Dechloromonas hankyongensis TaxID=2908002 RepID=A0ABS9K435_9RHOO|nr:glycine zipper 2TM domain-containing protein [Dechloromonas hankyongensis]MCG2577915.1 glycine zipper 2TM domain-containing protein [Dechloromonas hankyongensis]
MDKSMVKGVAIGAVAMVAISASGVTGYKMLSKPKSAEVLAVEEIKEKVRVPREDCRDVQVQRKAPVQDEHRIAGTVIGGVLGGVVGNQIGRGKGNTLATVAGAAAGGYAGNTVQKGMQDRDTVATVEHRCRTVYETSDKLAGYDVSYRLDGKEGRVRMDHDPGKTIPVKDGKLVLESPTAVN